MYERLFAEYRKLNEIHSDVLMIALKKLTELGEGDFATDVLDTLEKRLGEAELTPSKREPVSK